MKLWCGDGSHKQPAISAAFVILPQAGRFVNLKMGKIKKSLLFFRFRDMIIPAY